MTKAHITLPVSHNKAIISWSSGKDSAFALEKARQDFDVVGMLTTVTTDFDRVSMHGVRRELLRLQADAVGLVCHQVDIPSPCSNETYEHAMAEIMHKLRADGITHMIFGDLYLQGIRDYREKKLSPLGIQCVFPLWQRDTKALAREMVDAGLRATITCVDPKQLDASFAGRSFDHALLDDLPAHVDPCGENGEFHTVVTAGPMFRAPIPTRVGDVVTRDGFVFADVLPTAEV